MKTRTCPSCGTRLGLFMAYCHHCGEEQKLTLGLKGRRCPECRTEVSRAFNYCYACGEDVNPSGWLPPVKRAAGYSLYWECDSGDCDGLVADHMNYCPSCGEDQDWHGIWGKRCCTTCDTGISDDWGFCVACGEEAEELMAKPAGLCPACDEVVRAEVIRVAGAGRDECECPECGAEIYVCMGVGCTNYALGGDYVNNMYCQACAKKAGERGWELVSTIPGLIKTVAKL